MDVSGKNERLWIRKHESDSGSWNEYSLGVSKKGKDGKYVNHYMKVRFAGAVDVPADLKSGSKMDYSGFMTVDSYMGKDGKEVIRPMVMIMDADFPEYVAIEGSGFEEAEEDIPF